MHFLGGLLLFAGGLLSNLLVHVWLGEWDHFGLLALVTGVVNALAALFVYLHIRTADENQTLYKIMFGVMYLFGFGGGIYLYYL